MPPSPRSSRRSAASSAESAPASPASSTGTAAESVEPNDSLVSESTDSAGEALGVAASAPFTQLIELETEARNRLAQVPKIKLECLLDTINRTIVLMQASPWEVVVQEKALSILAALAERPAVPHPKSRGIPVTVASCGGIEAVTATMKHFLSRPDLLLLACKALSSILIHAGGAQMTLEPVVHVLVLAMKAHLSPAHVLLQKHACKIFQLIMTLPVSAGSGQHIVLEKGGLAATLHAMRFYDPRQARAGAQLQPRADFRDMQLAGCMVLHRLDVNGRVWVAENGGIELLLQALAYNLHDGVLRREALSALADFASCPAHAFKLTDRDSIQTVVDAMRLNRGDAWVQQLGCTIFGSLALLAYPWLDIRTTILATERTDWECSALHAVVMAMLSHSGNACVESAAWSALVGLVHGDQKMMSRVSECMFELPSDPRQSE